MATNAKVKKFTFIISARFGDEWKPVANYSSSKASMPGAVAAFYKFFNGWMIENVEYRFDGTNERGETIFMDSHVPVWDS